jgi:translation initiation factor 3 subunit A
MYKYVDLAVEMKQARKIKDALINYRNACQQVNVTSLGDVIEYLVEVASSKAEEASQEAQAIVGDIGDLEAEDSPEEMILSFVSGEKSADRTDREVVMPWFKLLWETHRNVLDVLRNNSRLEGLYATAAKRTFGFCVTYKRTTEFRRLCDILRNHLGTLIKYKDQQGRDRTDLGVPATWESYIDVRFEQLKTACTLELWAEAFRSVEDIQGLVGSPPKGIKGPKASLMATYYARLTQIFTRSEARLYNAYAWYRLFTFSRSFNKGLTQDDLVAMASNVVLSALSVLPYDRGNTAARGYDIRPHEKENSARMAAILGFNVDRLDRRVLLSRQALLADIERKGLLQLVPPQVKAVFSALEGDFNPLKLCQTLSPVLDELKTLGEELKPTDACPAGESAADLMAYVPFIQQVALSRTIRQLSEVYSTMRVSSLSGLAPFGWSFDESEALILDAVRHGFLQARFDHRNGTVHFGGSGDDRGSDGVKSQVASAAKKLSKALTAINAKHSSVASGVVSRNGARRSAAISKAMEMAEDENKRALARKQVIERRKEEHERIILQKEMEEEAKRQEAEAKLRAEEEKRKIAERVRREEERILKEMQEEEQNRVKAELAARGRKVEDSENLDVAALKAEMLREENKSEQDMRRRLTKLIKQMDHLERAKREEEAPLREEYMKGKVINEEETWKLEQTAALEAHKKAWEHDLAVKQKVQRMQEDAKSLADTIQTRRAAEFEALRIEKQKAAEAAREARKMERDIARKREYVRRCCVEIEKRRREEEEARQEEERERREREQAEHQRKLDEIAEKQRQREAEIEERARGGGARDQPADDGARGGGGGGRFVPPHLRRGSGPAAPDGGGGGWRDSGGAREGGRWGSDRREPPPVRGGSRW